MGQNRYKRYSRVDPRALNIAIYSVGFRRKRSSDASVDGCNGYTQRYPGARDLKHDFYFSITHLRNCEEVQRRHQKLTDGAKGQFKCRILFYFILNKLKDASNDL